MFQSKITYEEFCDYINEIKATNDLDRDLIRACGSFSKRTRYEFGIEIPILSDSVIELLEAIFEDSRGAISFFVYELDCGRYKDEPFIDEDGKSVKLNSVKDLWDYLMNHN